MKCSAPRRYIRTVFLAYPISDKACANLSSRDPAGPFRSTCIRSRDLKNFDSMGQAYNPAPGATPKGCCLQDSPAAAFGPASAVFDGFVPPALDGPGDISSSRPGASCAISADSPSRLADTPDRKRPSADDNLSGVGSGIRGGCIPAAEDDND